MKEICFQAGSARRVALRRTGDVDADAVHAYDVRDASVRATRAACTQNQILERSRAAAALQPAAMKRSSDQNADEEVIGNTRPK